MECAVCYDECARACKLVCGHTFCTKCVKEWYNKGTGTGCPMCRRPMYFKGFHQARDAWDEEAYDTRCSEILSDSMDACITEAFEMAEYFPNKYRKQILEETITDLADMERTFRFLKYEGLSADDIDYVINDTDDYYSDRHINHFRYIDEPVKEWSSRHPGSSTASRFGARSRARQDAWFTVSLIYLI